MRRRSASVALLAAVAARGGEGFADPLAEGELPAGRYKTSAFEPRVLLEVPAGWATLHEGAAFFDVNRPLLQPEQEGGPIWDVAILVARLDGDEAPGDVIDGLEENPSLEVSGEARAALDGAEGISVDVEPTSESTIVSFPEGSLAAFPGRKLRVYAVDVDGRTIVLVVDGAAETFDEDLEAARPVLDSLEFG